MTNSERPAKKRYQRNFFRPMGLGPVLHDRTTNCSVLERGRQPRDPLASERALRLWIRSNMDPDTKVSVRPSANVRSFAVSDFQLVRI